MPPALKTRLETGARMEPTMNLVATTTLIANQLTRNDIFEITCGHEESEIARLIRMRLGMETARYGDGIVLPAMNSSQVEGKPVTIEFTTDGGEGRLVFRTMDGIVCVSQTMDADSMTDPTSLPGSRPSEGLADLYAPIMQMGHFERGRYETALLNLRDALRSVNGDFCRSAVEAVTVVTDSIDSMDYDD